MWHGLCKLNNKKKKELVMKNYSILLIDDEDSQREPLKGFLAKKAFQVFDASSCDAGIELLKKNPVDLVITDFKMPGKTGEDVLREVKNINPMIPVVVMTAHGNIDLAVSLMKNGAFDYIQKPIELEELLQIIDKAEERQLLISENALLKGQLKEKYSFDSIISNSGEMEEVLNTAGRIATSKASALIRGESGTGKELVARAIHFASDRKDKPFVVVNCAAMPETLFESELFGHEKGAYTGANKQRIGKFEQADGGTLFIDEVGDIPLQVQVKLLRAVQFGEFERLGGSQLIKPDVRIITATNRNLEEMISAGEFREDLYYRFNVVTINIPPLRKRRADISPLVNYFVDKYALQNGKDVNAVSKEAMDYLMKYNFPGNVRELENIVQRAVVLTRNNIISQKDLPRLDNNPQVNSFRPDFDEIELGDLNAKVEELEKSMIVRALDKTDGNQVKAADILNISERTLRYKLSKYKIK